MTHWVISVNLVARVGADSVLRGEEPIMEQRSSLPMDHLTVLTYLGGGVSSLLDGVMGEEQRTRHYISWYV